MKKDTFVIGMDGGGTKTHAVILDQHGTVMAEHTLGPSNFQIIGVEKAADVLHELVRLCCESAECSPKHVAAVVCGLTGAGRAGDQKRMADGLKAYAAAKRTPLKTVLVESDARIALEGAFNGAPGIILIAGTGSIAFGKDAKGTVHRVGGWGRVLGDEGSGYFIGRLGLTAVTRELDGRGEKTALTKMLASKCGLKDQTSIINAVYKENFDVASVAPLVLDAAAKKDAEAHAIVEFAVMELTEHIKTLSERLTVKSAKNVKTKLPLSLIGGLIANTTILSTMLQQHIAVNIPAVQVTAPMSSPAYGAALLGMRTR